VIDYDVLDQFGTNDRRFRAVFGAKDGELNEDGKRLYAATETTKTEEEFASMLHKHRKRWEDRISTRIQHGREFSMRYYRFFMAADLAFDTSPLTPQRFAHLLYATGDMKMNVLYDEIKGMAGQKVADGLFIRDKKNPHNITALDTDKLTDFTISLVRPYIRRSVAAQVNRYENLHPFLKYESRSQSMIAKLRADAMSERAEIMADQFGYRHAIAQEIRGMFMHSHSVTFVENSWSCQRQLFKIPDEVSESGWRTEERIEREGVRFKRAHPTRVFYDTRFPLSSLNHDNGCQYAGFWDLVSYRDVKNNSGFFNIDSIPYSGSLNSLVHKNSAYFNYYYASTIKSIFDTGAVGAEANRRDANTYNYYSTDHEDECLWLTHYYEKVTPKEVGLGGYPHPVWMHLIIAGDNTVVFAEVLPSRPGYCMAYDEDDERMVNISMALDILPYQDQVSNLFSQMLYLLQIQNLLILAVDSDVVNSDIRTQLKEVIEGRKWANKAHLIEFSSKMEEIFDQSIQQKKPIQVFQASVTNVISDLTSSIASIIRMLERNQMMSPNEMGQFVERETSATEVHVVGSSSNDLHAFKSSGIDEARQAMKVIIYESTIACGSNKVRLTVPERYPEAVLEAAGFMIAPDEQGYLKENAGLTLVGTKERLIGEFIFSSRDGAERASNTESAKVLMELIRYILGSEPTFKAFVDSFGMEQVTKAISEVFRLAGSPMDLKLPVNFSEAHFRASLGDSQELEQMRSQIVAKLDELAQRMDQVEAVAEDYVSSQEQQPQPGPQPGQMPVPVRPPNGAPF
jgi:hypothetical protein